jgi:hypothetical protein
MINTSGLNEQKLLRSYLAVSFVSSFEPFFSGEQLIFVPVNSLASKGRISIVYKDG